VLGKVLLGQATVNAANLHHFLFHRFCHTTRPMLTLSGITKAYGGRTLFSDVTLQLNREDRIGLVGPNGAGKSTLFGIILGEAAPDDGKIMTERNVTIGYLPQESAPVGNETVIEIATAISPEFVKLRRVIKAWEHDHPIEALHPGTSTTTSTTATTN
jgi:ATP-binding cassette subfamily F protein 3